MCICIHTHVYTVHQSSILNCDNITLPHVDGILVIYLKFMKTHAVVWLGFSQGVHSGSQWSSITFIKVHQSLVGFWKVNFKRTLLMSNLHILLSGINFFILKIENIILYFVSLGIFLILPNYSKILSHGSESVYFSSHPHFFAGKTGTPQPG